MTLFHEVNRTLTDYVTTGMEEICGHHGEKFFAAWSHYISQNFLRPVLQKAPVNMITFALSFTQIQSSFTGLPRQRLTKRLRKRKSALNRGWEIIGIVDKLSLSYNNQLWLRRLRSTSKHRSIEYDTRDGGDDVGQRRFGEAEEYKRCCCWEKETKSAGYGFHQFQVVSLLFVLIMYQFINRVKKFADLRQLWGFPCQGTTRPIQGTRSTFLTLLENCDSSSTLLCIRPFIIRSSSKHIDKQPSLATQHHIWWSQLKQYVSCR